MAVELATMSDVLGRLPELGRMVRIWLDRYRSREIFDFPGTARLFQLTPGRPDIVHCHTSTVSLLT